MTAANPDLDGRTIGRSIGETIRLRTDQLTPAERKVARALVATNLMAGFDSVSALARRAGVSGPTVLRFATKLGFGGYPAFQRALRADLEARIAGPPQRYPRAGPARARAKGRDDGVLPRARDAFVRGITDTFDAMAEAEFAAVADLLADSRRSIVLGGGRFSHTLAETLYAHLNRLRANVRLVGFGPAGRMEQVLDLGRRDVFVAFDYRRYQTDTIALTRLAARRGASVVLLTDPWLSPAADVADHVLVSNVEAPAPRDTMVPALALVETLVAAVLARLGGAAVKRIEALESLRLGATEGRVESRARIAARRAADAQGGS